MSEPWDSSRERVDKMGKYTVANGNLGRFPSRPVPYYLLIQYSKVSTVSTCKYFFYPFFH